MYIKFIHIVYKQNSITKVLKKINHLLQLKLIIKSFKKFKRNFIVYFKLFNNLL